MYLVIDTETTGLPSKIPGTRRFYDPMTNTSAYDNSRVVQVAWLVMDTNFAVRDTKNLIIKPDNFEITNSAFHGITQDHATTNGIPITHALHALYDSITAHNVKVIVAHNLEFDESILLAEIYRHLKSDKNDQKVLSLASMIEQNMRRVCTMKTSKSLFSTYKYPKLAELYELLTDGEELVNAHDAMSDVEHCAACFVHMVVKHPNLFNPKCINP